MVGLANLALLCCAAVWRRTWGTQRALSPGGGALPWSCLVVATGEADAQAVAEAAGRHGCTHDAVFSTCVSRSCSCSNRSSRPFHCSPCQPAYFLLHVLLYLEFALASRLAQLAASAAASPASLCAVHTACHALCSSTPLAGGPSR